MSDPNESLSTYLGRQFSGMQSGGSSSGGMSFSYYDPRYDKRLQAQSAQADILKKLQKQQNKANKANESRYQGILDQYSNLGQAGMTRIGQQEQQALASGTQDLASRGLGNTTIRGSMARGVASDAELARQQLGESVATQKAGVMERRTDAGPDLSLYSNLMMNAAQR